MSIGQTQSIALLGLTGSVVEIEVDISDGIPMYSLLGLPDAALQESREYYESFASKCINALVEKCKLCAIIF